MSKRHRADETDPDDWEDPDESDQDDEDDSADTDACPYCGAPIYEQAEVCPRCQNYISLEDTRRRPPIWIIIGVVLCLAVIIAIWLFGLWL